MVGLRIHFRARTIAASMAIGRPEASDDTSLATGTQRRMAQARLCCFARNDGAAGRGRKSGRAVVA
ncbi:hypothetical protein FJQ54_02860 [Sandaracinobacter neustonicus]|uniref:Uncharacterized protein n=1 Tax=Sandaracinobacter neustonicus TaxID=1715348 RepID=A0A501XU58_9SPHN|nr:hypothetical protein FJQ54_02860 [Sandaracinobacter neustonicus]